MAVGYSITSINCNSIFFFILKSAVLLIQNYVKQINGKMTIKFINYCLWIEDISANITKIIFLWLHQFFFHLNTNYTNQCYVFRYIRSIAYTNLCIRNKRASVAHIEFHKNFIHFNKLKKISQFSRIVFTSKIEVISIPQCSEHRICKSTIKQPPTIRWIWLNASRKIC